MKLLANCKLTSGRLVYCWRYFNMKTYVISYHNSFIWFLSGCLWSAGHSRHILPFIWLIVCLCMCASIWASQGHQSFSYCYILIQLSTNIWHVKQACGTQVTWLCKRSRSHLEKFKGWKVLNKLICPQAMHCRLHSMIDT